LRIPTYRLGRAAGGAAMTDDESTVASIYEEMPRNRYSRYRRQVMQVNMYPDSYL